MGGEPSDDDIILNCVAGGRFRYFGATTLGKPRPLLTRTYSCHYSLSGSHGGPPGRLSEYTLIVKTPAKSGRLLDLSVSTSMPAIDTYIVKAFGTSWPQLLGIV